MDSDSLQMKVGVSPKNKFVMCYSKHKDNPEQVKLINVEYQASLQDEIYQINTQVPFEYDENRLEPLDVTHISFKK